MNIDKPKPTVLKLHLIYSKLALMNFKTACRTFST